MNADRFEQIVQISPAYDKRSKDPKKDYGIGSATLRMLLQDRETKQAVHFVIYLGWYLPGSVPEELVQRSSIHYKTHVGFRAAAAQTSDPLPVDLGYHSREPRWEGQTETKCDVLGGSCYYDGSGLNAYDAWAVLIKDGHDGLWKFLENYYVETFDAKEAEA